MLSEKVRQYFDDNTIDQFLNPATEERIHTAAAILASLVRSGGSQVDDKYVVARAVELADRLLEELAKEEDDNG